MNKPEKKKRIEKPDDVVINISFPLEGEDAQRFYAYKKRAFLKTNAEAARQLLLQQLHDVMATERTAVV